MRIALSGNFPRIEKSKDWDSGKPLHNQWEIKSDNITLDNPGWNESVQQIAIKTAQDLGIKPDPREVKAELHKVHLWSSGASLRPYKELRESDTQKIASIADLDSFSNVAGCFGKLIICLPAAHRGGKVLLEYGGDVEEFVTEGSSLWGYSYLAW